VAGGIHLRPAATGFGLSRGALNRCRTCRAAGPCGRVWLTFKHRGSRSDRSPSCLLVVLPGALRSASLKSAGLPVVGTGAPATLIGSARLRFLDHPTNRHIVGEWCNETAILRRLLWLWIWPWLVAALAPLARSAHILGDQARPDFINQRLRASRIGSRSHLWRWVLGRTMGPRSWGGARPSGCCCRWTFPMVDGRSGGGCWA